MEGFLTAQDAKGISEINSREKSNCMVKSILDDVRRAAYTGVFYTMSSWTDQDLNDVETAMSKLRELGYVVELTMNEYTVLDGNKVKIKTAYDFTVSWD